MINMNNFGVYHQNSKKFYTHSLGSNRNWYYKCQCCNHCSFCIIRIIVFLLFRVTSLTPFVKHFDTLTNVWSTGAPKFPCWVYKWQYSYSSPIYLQLFLVFVDRFANFIIICPHLHIYCLSTAMGNSFIQSISVVSRMKCSNLWLTDIRSVFGWPSVGTESCGQFRKN